MPLIPRPHRRFSIYYPATYQTGLFEGHGTVWNLSLTGWRFSGNLPLRFGEVRSLTVNLSIDQTIYVAAGIVRCVGGEEYGVETLVIDDESQEELEDYLLQREEESTESIIPFRLREADIAFVCARVCYALNDPLTHLSMELLGRWKS